MTFDDAVRTHLTAVAERDYDTFVSTIATDGRLTLILPNGAVSNDAEDILEFHREWFDDPDWTISFEVLKRIEGSEFGFAVVGVAYDDVGPEGNPYHIDYLLSLLFLHEEGGWVLVHDQNTYQSTEPDSEENGTDPGDGEEG